LPPGEEMPKSWPAPKLVIPEAAMQQWRATAPEASDARPILMLAPGARGTERRWPIDNFAQLAGRAVDRGWTVWVSGGASDAALADAIKSDVKSARVLTGVPLVPTACQMAACDAFVGNNSGLLHLAAAVGTPSVGIFETAYTYSAPLNDWVRILNTTVAASAGMPAIWPSVEAVEQELALLPMTRSLA
jgi:lipopolysaccharide heptosyltransferase II